MMEDEARLWLSLFGSTPRPPSALESLEIQSLILGGLGFLRCGGGMIFRLSGTRKEAKAFLDELLPEIAFADGRYHQPHATIIALAAPAFDKFGLPPGSLATFPAAFLDGMSNRTRSRVLGDVGSSAPERWTW